MAVNWQQLRSNLHTFYDFTNKTVLFVGAGGRQLFNLGVAAKRVIAIDQDGKALGELMATIAGCGTSGRVEVIASSFAEIESSGDVVYFEFCLHEMNDPYGALLHARELSPDILVFDHLPGSPWSFYAAEEDKVRCSTEGMQRFGVRRHETFSIEQYFRNHAELHAKLAGQGPIAAERARQFAGATDIVIPMSYQLALL